MHFSTCSLPARVAQRTTPSLATSIPAGPSTTRVPAGRRTRQVLQAPEIEGKDLDGVAFKLSDYRGKVVLLDFWGDW